MTEADYWTTPRGHVAHRYRECIGLGRVEPLTEEERFLLNVPVCLRCEMRKRAEKR